jgi:hypothetical protein
MASAGLVDNLSSMYTINGATITVRDLRSRYAPRPHEPERFPAELVLRDLPRARSDDEITRIVARYATLRAWLLATSQADGQLADHARSSATAHVDAAPVDWSERSLLRRLIDTATRREDDQPWQTLARVAADAEAAGHLDGAFAARKAAWEAALGRGRLDIAAELARAVARLMERRGDAAAARRWDHTAGSLRRRARQLPPPPS